MSDTPRTDALLIEIAQDPHKGGCMPKAFAQELERENRQLQIAAQLVYERLHELGTFTNLQAILSAVLDGKEYL